MAAEIHHHLMEVCGEYFTSQQSVAKWCAEF
jgi:hypothetical protein